MNTNERKSVNQREEIKTKEKSKEEFLNFLEKNKQELNTGFGAFHTNNHGNW